MNGLYDGDFLGFRVPTSDERDAAIREAVVAVDANVLLDLYRFRPQTSRDLIALLSGIGDRLVVPHQALREFWRHRQRSQASPRAATSVATEALGKSGRSMTAALSTWAKQVGVDAAELGQLTHRVDDFVVSLTEDLQAVGAEGRTDGDPILADLEQLLAGRVTPPLDDETWEKCVEEARRRITEEEPPGYLDAEKEGGQSPEGGAGDYLVWYQAIHHARERDMDLLLVTRDEKEDWWWRRQSQFIGPRPELALEFHRLTGRRLFMMRPTDLLGRAEVLAIEVNEESTLDASRSTPTEEDYPPQPWTAEGLVALLERLEREAPVQAEALKLATSANGGRVTREQVYDLGGYSDDRMLRGFTRPFRRLTEALQAEGVVAEGVPQVFAARYPDGVKASYFVVPDHVADLLSELDDAPGRESGAA